MTPDTSLIEFILGFAEFPKKGTNRCLFGLSPQTRITYAGPVENPKKAEVKVSESPLFSKLFLDLGVRKLLCPFQCRA